MLSLTVPMSLALDPSLLALAVVAAAVGALHNAGGTASMVTVTVAVAVLARLGHAAARLVHEHHEEEGDCGQGGAGAEDLGCGHVGVLFALLLLAVMLLTE